MKIEQLAFNNLILRLISWKIWWLIFTGAHSLASTGEELFWGRWHSWCRWYFAANDFL